MTTPTPDNAASATPVAWLDLGRLTAKNMVYATGFKVTDAQSPLYSAATVTALEAEVADLKARLVKQRRELGAEADQADAEAKRVCGIAERAMNLLERLDPVEFQKFCKTEFDTLTGAGAK